MRTSQKYKSASGTAGGQKSRDPMQKAAGLPVLQTWGKINPVIFSG
jgi:hypothetical protein